MVGMGNVSVVITSYNQNEMIREAVDSVRRQKLRPDAIIVVDDGSTDPASVQVLDELDQAEDITVIRQGNAGPSAARNVGIRAARTDCVTVLDGDDRLLPTFLETTVGLLDGDASVVAASGWLRTFGVLDAVVKPTGGTIADFLSRNACPATFTFRRTVWEACGGYDESMRSGFEDWDFCLSLLAAAATAADTTATGQEPRIAIAPRRQVQTSPAWTNAWKRCGTSSTDIMPHTPLISRMRSWASKPRRSPGSTCGNVRSVNIPRCWRASRILAPS